MWPEKSSCKVVDAKETIRSWLVGYQSMSSLPDGERHREAEALPLPRVVLSQTGDSSGFKKVGAKSKNLKKEWKWQRGIIVHPLSDNQWIRGHFSMRKWESEKHKSWSMPAEGFKGHVATDGSLPGTAGKWGACGWAVVQLDYDVEKGPLHGMHGSMVAECGVQRTIKTAELTAFLYLLRKVCGPVKVHVDKEKLVGCEKVRKSVLSQEPEMQTCG